MFGGFSRHFSACKYFKERILLFAVGINIDERDRGKVRVLPPHFL